MNYDIFCTSKGGSEQCKLQGLNEFKSYRGRCYKLSDEERQFSEARQECDSLSTNSTRIDLASIRDADENQFITTLRHYTGSLGWISWIGIRKDNDIGWKDYQSFGKWEDGLDLSTWTNWDDGEPTNVSWVYLL